MSSRHLIWISAAAATLTMGLASAHSYSENPNYSNGYDQARTVRCESTGSQRTFCPVNTMGKVRITRQLSRRACILGRNWSYSSTGIWVDHGCRADFLVSQRTAHQNQNAVVEDNHYVDGSGRLIHCESTASGRTYCGDSHNRYSMSGNRDPDCIEGRTWGSDGRGVWVSGNCDADFSRMPYDNGGYNDGSPGSTEINHTHTVDSSGQIIHCQSTADGRTYCGDHDSQYIITGTRDPDCMEGETYGRDEYGTWVSGDCDAQFGIDPSYDYQRRH